MREVSDRELGCFLAALPDEFGALRPFFRAALAFGGAVGFASRHGSIDTLTPEDEAGIEAAFHAMGGSFAEDESLGATFHAYLDRCVKSSAVSPEYTCITNFCDLYASMLMRKLGEDV